MALSQKQEKFINAYMENPILPMKEYAVNLGINPSTVYNWKSKNTNGFADELEKRLNQKWEEAKHAASETMFSLCREGDFKAAKYILDYSGFAPATKIEADVNTTINITIDGESEE